MLITKFKRAPNNVPLKNKYIVYDKMVLESLKTMPYKTLKDYPNYLIYSNGIIKNISRKQFVTPTIKKKYPTVMLVNVKKVRHSLRVHILVARAFIPNHDPKNLVEVDHIDQNPYNVNVVNLRWVTKQQNKWNRRKKKKPCYSKYVGVSWHICTNQWIANIRDCGKRITQYFDTEKEAFDAYETAARRIKGIFYRPQIWISESIE
jgi:HNH endonuclease/AP2 domain